MKTSGMGYLGGLLLLVLAFSFTVSGTQAKCEERETSAFQNCISQHAMAFSPLLHISSCDRKLITEHLCTKFVFIVDCVNEIRTSPSCSRANLLSSQMNFACKLNDLQEECLDAPELDTDDILTMESSSGDNSTMTEFSSGDDTQPMDPSAHSRSRRIMNFAGSLITAILVLVLSADVQGQCSQRDVGTMMACTMPHAMKFYHTIGAGQRCDRNRITSSICSDFATIIACINRRYVSRICRPYAVNEFNSRLPLSCNVYDLMQVCTNAPSFSLR